MYNKNGSYQNNHSIPQHVAADVTRSRSFTLPSNASSDPTSDNPEAMLPSYDWVINRIRELRQSSERLLSPQGEIIPESSHPVYPSGSPNRSPRLVLDQSSSVVNEGKQHEIHIKQKEILDKKGEQNLSSAFDNCRSSRPRERQNSSAFRSKSETRESDFSREFSNLEKTSQVHDGRSERGKDNVHVNLRTNSFDNVHDFNIPGNGIQSKAQKSSSDSKIVSKDDTLLKNLDDAIENLAHWSRQIQSLTEPYSDSLDTNMHAGRSNPKFKTVRVHKKRTTYSYDPRTPTHRAPALSAPVFNNDQPGTVGTSPRGTETMEEPVRQQRIGADRTKASPPSRTESFGLPPHPDRSRPVQRSGSLGGYESDSAVYKPKGRENSPEAWLRNPGALPQKESQYWNRLEGLRSPDDKRRHENDMVSSTESIPNGPKTPKFPVGPKGYANMVKTCIAVVGKPPHGPDEPLPLSPTRKQPDSMDFLQTSFPAFQASPTREIPPRIPEVQETEIDFIDRTEQSKPSHMRPTQPIEAQVDRVPRHVLNMVESQPRKNFYDNLQVGKPVNGSYAPGIETRGGVPEQPISPGSRTFNGAMQPRVPYHHPMQAASSRQQETEIHYAEVVIEPPKDRSNKRPRVEDNEHVSYAHIRPHVSSEPHPAYRTNDTVQYAQINREPVSSPRTVLQEDVQYPTVQNQPHRYTAQSYQPRPVQEEPITKVHLEPVKVELQTLPEEPQRYPAYTVNRQQPQSYPVYSQPIDAQVVIDKKTPTVQFQSPDHRPLSSTPNQTPPHATVNPPHATVTPPHATFTPPTTAARMNQSPQTTPSQTANLSYSPAKTAQLSQHVVPQSAQVSHTTLASYQPVSSSHPSSQPNFAHSEPITRTTITQHTVYSTKGVESHSQPQHEQRMPYQQQAPQADSYQHPSNVQPQQIMQPPAPQQHHYTHVSQQPPVSQYVPVSQQPPVSHYAPVSPQAASPQQPSQLPEISLSESTPPVSQLVEEAPLLEMRLGGEEANQFPSLQQGSTPPPPIYPTYSDRMKNKPHVMYPTFSDRHRKAGPRIDEAVQSGAPGANYRTLYDNRGANRGRGSYGSDSSAVSPGTTSPVRQAISPTGPSPSPSGRSTPSNFYLMPYTSPYGSNTSLADPSREHVRFVKDLSAWWYKPSITRDDAITMLKDKAPGNFVVRDSNSFPGAFGLAVKVAQPPSNVPTKKGTDPTNELVRHFLIEPNARGVRLKGCANEPIFGSLSSLIYQHTLTQLALPCKLVLPDIDPSGGVDSPDIIDPSSAAVLLSQGAACNVLYLKSFDMESLTGPNAIREAMARLLTEKEKPVAVKVHFKVSSKGITLTDSARKLFFRKHFPVDSVLYSGVDPGQRKWNQTEGLKVTDAKVFGFIAASQVV